MLPAMRSNRGNTPTRSPVAALGRLPLLRGVPKSELKDLLAAGEWVEVPKGRTLIRQGDNADHAVLVVHGQLKAWVGEGHRERGVSNIYAGELVGEAGLYAASAQRTATVRASADSQCLRLTRTALESLGGTQTLAILQRHMLGTMARRLRVTTLAVRREWKSHPAQQPPSAPPEPLVADPPKVAANQTAEPAAKPAERASIWKRLGRFLGETA
jgi:CRP-like cAMP-binding protein